MAFMYLSKSSEIPPISIKALTATVPEPMIMIRLWAVSVYITAVSPPKNTHHLSMLVSNVYKLKFNLPVTVQSDVTANNKTMLT